jgi:hypothetical protein
MRSYLSGRAGCLYRQAAGSWNVLDTLGDVIICNHLSATRRFRHVPEPFMRFHEVLWDSMRFYDVPVNRSVPTEANRGLTSYKMLEDTRLCSLEPLFWEYLLFWPFVVFVVLESVCGVLPCRVFRYTEMDVTVQALYTSAMPKYTLQLV